MSRLFAKIIQWIEDNVPTQCARCKHWHPNKDISHTMHLTGVIVPLCKECVIEVYSPWLQKQ
jgi:hypothetical protein